jgi:hypothetical protein
MDATTATTSDLVNAYADSRVWFAVNETTGRTREGDSRHRRHCAIVDELRRRGVLSH